MRIFIQFDDPYVPHPNVLEPLFLDLIAMGIAVNTPIDQEVNMVYLVSVLPKPTESHSKASLCFFSFLLKLLAFFN